MEGNGESNKIMLGSEAEAKDIIDYFIDFYEERRSKGLAPEKKKSILMMKL